MGSPVTGPARRVRVPGKVKLAATVAVASAIALGVAGAARVPELLPAEDGPALAARGAPPAERISRGIAPSVAAGPFHPVAGQFDYGEADARFGASRGGRPHEGQDVLARAGTPLVAVRDGVVVEEAGARSAISGGRGNYIAIHSETEDRTYVYLHMRERSGLREGDSVSAGDRVGAVGCSGSCWGDHLHFEVRLGRGTEARPIDPLPLLRRWSPADTGA